MPISEEFRKMAENFHQDFLLAPDTLADATKFVFAQLNVGRTEKPESFSLRDRQ